MGLCRIASLRRIVPFRGVLAKIGDHEERSRLRPRALGSRRGAGVDDLRSGPVEPRTSLIRKGIDGAQERSTRLPRHAHLGRVVRHQEPGPRRGEPRAPLPVHVVGLERFAESDAEITQFVEGDPREKARTLVIRLLHEAEDKEMFSLDEHGADGKGLAAA